MIDKHALPALILMLLALLTTAVAQEPGVDSEADSRTGGYTKEQMLLFGTHHLDNISSESVLHYDFRQSGSHTREIEDAVMITITSVGEDGAKDLSVDFLSGTHKKPFANIEKFHSNPLLMYFLQWDTEKMGGGRRVTHHHFRHLIRQAMRNDMRGEEVVVTHGGRKLQGHRLFFRPLASKQDDQRYEAYAGKLYEFVLIESIPGHIYSISTLIVGDDASAEPLESVRLSFDRLEPVNPPEKQGDLHYDDR